MIHYPFGMTAILIASGNDHKVEEISAVLGELDIQCFGLADLDGAFAEPDEDGDTFEENARAKARAYAAATGRLCLADDSGLEIDALQGRPGVRSARYALNGDSNDLPRTERDRLNNERVLSELAEVPPGQRSARFVCTLALARPNGQVIEEVRGTFEGRIGIPPRVPAGRNGFGYDPLFLVGPDFGRTSAEMAPAEKNARSHRGEALRKLADRLRAHPV